MATEDVSRETPDEQTRKTASKSNIGYVFARYVAPLIGSLWAYLGGKHTDMFVSMHVYRRGDCDFLAVIKRESDDGGVPLVVFGSGVDWLTAIQAANVAINNNKWREDKVKK